ncbi:metal ABC transporter ATP-binding protein [Pseudarthrobacter sp. NamE2]|uniref:zinc ABC transporter ATP-binding protein AztA n=1 Tax=Pseudarthrobacter sp. NamE2 TaxID=2576838 RepID=UPI0010FD8F82|nr:zinc ABC transporter ATP-binding protein AztA [Pseudarthrobacter sp. NamE2]TLM81720.1 metal ABC transporter ATP-binding protein [Pseudarthrobacter sp. NamE2]
MAALTISGIGYAYPDRQVLEEVSLALMPGTHTVLTGRNGSGKSTLLGLAAGVLKPARGMVSAGSRPALVIQHTRTPENLPCTVRQTVEMGRWPHRRGLLPLRRADRQKVSAALERMGIADLADRQLQELSGGQRQRTLIAQGLAQEADILLLDEPTAGLDSSAHALIRAAVADELRRGVTVLESSHDPGDIGRADRVVMLDAGRIASDTQTA